jgi:biopolymer transport protein ExbD
LRRISLTPLADLVFILLVFFILETSFTEFRELAFNLPEQKEQGKSAGELLKIELFEDGKMWIQGEAITLNNLGVFLDAEQFGSATAITIEVQGRAPLQLLVHVMDQLKVRELEKIQILPLDKKAET